MKDYNPHDENPNQCQICKWNGGHHADDCPNQTCARCERLASLLDWAETLILNGEAPAHSTPEEWNEIRHNWNAQKHAALSAPEVKP